MIKTAKRTIYIILAFALGICLPSIASASDTCAIGMICGNSTVQEDTQTVTAVSDDSIHQAYTGNVDGKNMIEVKNGKVYEDFGDGSAPQLVAEIDKNGDLVSTKDHSLITASNGNGGLVTAEQNAAAGTCSTAYTTANISCSATDYAPIISALLPGFASTSSDDIAQACKKSADAGKMAAAINVTAAGTCYKSKSVCEEKCKAVANDPNNPEKAQAVGYAKECGEMEINAMMMTMSAMQALASMQQANNCSELASDSDDLFKCSKPENASDPEECPSMACTSMYPQNYDHPDCVSFQSSELANLCPGPSCAASCQMAQYASNALCIQYGGTSYTTDQDINAFTVPTFDDDLSTGLGIDAEEDPFFTPEFTGFEGDGADNGTLAAKGTTGGSNLGGGGGGSPGGGSGGAASGGGGGYDTNIIGKASGGGGAVSGGGFAGGYAGGAGSAWKKAGRGAGEGKSNSQFDLSKLFPQKDKQKRKAASLGNKSLDSMGITKANGLSNFQKVTRMINKKRPELINK